MKAFLDIQNLHAWYGSTKVLHGIDLKVDQQSVIVILGANGAGKTSLMRSVSQMMRTEGEIFFDGQQINGKSTEDIARLGIAHVPSGRGTFANFSVEDNLSIGSLARKDKRQVSSDMEKMFSYFPRLKERREQQAGTLSGGEQQMLAIARALMLKPRLLLIDEPSFGLAPLAVKELFNLLRTINIEEKLSILLAEQNVSQALKIANYAYLLETGRCVKQGSAAELSNDEIVQKTYLGMPTH